MRKIKATALSLSLAIFVSLLALVQPTRPILAAVRSDLPTAANLHQELTRHCIEEVGNEEFEEPGNQASCWQIEEPNRVAARPEFFREADLPAWPLRPIHRKLLPPSPSDG